jgi:UDP-N-acetylglucosamine 2-epimerase (non-hydrolysing)
LAPIINEFEKYTTLFDVTVCIAGQNHEMLDNVLPTFAIIPNLDLSIVKRDQDLFTISEKIQNNMKNILLESEPDLIIVHGDTTTAAITA